jgi:hypothetical protein
MASRALLLLLPLCSANTLLRQYDQASPQCHMLSSARAKQLLFYDARLELNLSIPLPSPHPSLLPPSSNAHARYLRQQSPTNKPTSNKRTGEKESEEEEKEDCSRGGQNFLNSTYGALTFQLDHSIITYGRVFKANSENIVDSFIKSSQHASSLFNASFTKLNHAIGSKDSQELDHRLAQQGHLLKKSPRKLFSFFRHPIHHFLSGITESQFRYECRLHDTDLTNPAVHHCIEQKQNTSKLIVSERFTKKVLKSIFSCDSSATGAYLTTIRHFSPQSTSLHEWQPQFIGYLENFTTHWSELEVLVSVPLSLSLSLCLSLSVV